MNRLEQCNRLIRDIERARDTKDSDLYRRLMKLVASIAYAESVECDEGAPVAEISHG